MDNTQTNDDTQTGVMDENFKIDFDLLMPPPPEFPDPEEIFERLMQKIDPRFAPSNQEKLKEQLLQAPVEERLRIIKDYNKAMAEYEKQAAELFSDLKQVVSSYRNCIESASRFLDEIKADAVFEDESSAA